MGLLTEESGKSPLTRRKTRVGVIDDHEAVRLGIQSAAEDSGYDFIAAAGTVPEFIALLGGQECEVAVLDLSLGDGSSVTQNVKSLQAVGCAVLVHSIADRVALVREALAAGVSGVIPKSSSTRTGEVLNNLEWASAIDADRDFAKAQLGRREREILHLYAAGMPLKSAADRLGIGFNTAREYLDRIRSKYIEVGRPAPTKVDLLRRAVEDGILPGIDPDGVDER